MATRFAALRFTRTLSIEVSRKRCSIRKDDKFATAADSEQWKTDPDLGGINKK